MREREQACLGKIIVTRALVLQWTQLLPKYGVIHGPRHSDFAEPKRQRICVQCTYFKPDRSDTTPSISTSKTTLLHHQYSISQNRFSSMLTWFCCRSNKPRGKPTATVLSLFMPTTIIKVIRVAQGVISETTWFWLSLSLPP